jgi:hypothetical protein
MSTKSALMVDPPSGWRYGFPKPYFKSKIANTAELALWLLDNGYPQHELNSMGKELRGIRFWVSK